MPKELIKPTATQKGQGMENPTPRKPMSDAERVADWRTRLKERGGYGDAAASLITDFAIKARSFEYDQHGNLRPAGGILVTMFIRLGTRLQEAASVSEEDALAANAQLLQYFSKKPLGDTVEDWRTRYSSNGVQRTAIDQFFGFSGRKFHEYDSGERFLFNIRDAAWPSRKEEAAGTGGSFAERFMIFSKAICRIFMTGSDAVEKLFGDFFHEEKPRLPDWIEERDDGKLYCKEPGCGSEVTQDSKGNLICSNPLCDHNVAAGNFALPESFTNQGGTAPAAQSGTQSGGRDRRDHRHHDHDEGDMPRQQKFKKKGPRFRENDADLPEPQEVPETDTPAVPIGESSEGLGNIGQAFGTALDGLKLS